MIGAVATVAPNLINREKGFAPNGFQRGRLTAFHDETESVSLSAADLVIIRRKCVALEIRRAAGIAGGEIKFSGFRKKMLRCVIVAVAGLVGDEKVGSAPLRHRRHRHGAAVHFEIIIAIVVRALTQKLLMLTLPVEGGQRPVSFSV